MKTGLEAEKVVTAAVSMYRLMDPWRVGTTGRFAGQGQEAKRGPKRQMIIDQGTGMMVSDSR